MARLRRSHAPPPSCWPTRPELPTSEATILPDDRFDHLFIAPQSFDATLAFYRDGLGWSVIRAWGSAGAPRGAMLDGGGVQLVLAEQHAAADRSWSHGMHGARPTLHLRVDDLDARFTQLAESAVVVVAPEGTHWGTRWFVVKDPDDNLIAFEQAAPGAA